MRYLLDTNLLSELRKRDRGNRGVQVWAQSHDPALAALSVVSVAEVRRGIEKQRARNAPHAVLLEWWLVEVLAEFGERILPVTLEIAERWGHLLGTTALPERDSLLAATALEHDLTVVTRNVSDFHGTGVRLLNPCK